MCVCPKSSSSMKNITRYWLEFTFFHSLVMLLMTWCFNIYLLYPIHICQCVINVCVCVWVLQTNWHHQQSICRIFIYYFFCSLSLSALICWIFSITTMGVNWLWFSLSLLFFWIIIIFFYSSLVHQIPVSFHKIINPVILILSHTHIHTYTQTARPYSLISFSFSILFFFIHSDNEPKNTKQR